MGWFKRFKDGIQTATKNKKEAPDGLWYKCRSCGDTSTVKEMREQFYICSKCGHHARIGSGDYFDIIFDGKYEELFENLSSYDFLEFSDLQSYNDRLEKAKVKTGLTEAISIAVGKVNKKPLLIAAMDFSFIGGSMGSVMGERIS